MAWSSGSTAPQGAAIKDGLGGWMLWTPVAVCFVLLLWLTLYAQPPVDTEPTPPRCVIEVRVTETC